VPPFDAGLIMNENIELADTAGSQS
jgi:hypothetical protein